MINNNLIKDKLMQYKAENQPKINEKKKEKKKKKNKKDNKEEKEKESLDTKKIKYFFNKLKYINELIVLINIYSNEIERFPNSILNETNLDIKNYIIEMILAVHDISTVLYYNKNAINKIFPHYYKLVIFFLKKKKIILEILKDIAKNKKLILAKDYIYLLDDIDEDYEFFINRSFNAFDKEYIYKCVVSSIFEIYKKTSINKDYSLEKFLKKYDIFNEINFPPFSLLEIKDYEYFYEEKDEREKEENENLNKEYQKFNLIRANLIDQYKDISFSSFMGVLSGKTTNKKIDYGMKFVNLFKSFINSTESMNLVNYRTFLCIMVKSLLYDSQHIQELFKELCYDKYFFKNLNRELNYHIVQCINSVKKYELFFGCFKITDITKLTIQFLQLLGEGFNIAFHDNILKGIIKLKKNKKIVKDNKTNEKDEQDGNEKENDSEDSDNNNNLIINEETIEKAIKMTVKKELNKRRVVPLRSMDWTIYDSMIYNLRIIYHLMNLSTSIEGELAFDKLCILTSNIIDFLIEYIDTKKDLNYIIDNNIKDLFFGKHNNYDIADTSKINKKGVFSIFTLKIKNKSNEPIYQYKLRKTMIAYMKIKYFQLLKAYLQIGNKEVFVHLIISNNLGPFDLLGEIIYYMKELINNLIFKNYNKYNHLLKIDDIQSYIEKLNDLYKYDDDFRTSIEMSVIFQITIIIAILEEKYKITMLKTFFKNEKKKENIIINKEKEFPLSNEEKEDHFEDEVTVHFPKNEANYYHPPYKSEDNLIDNYDIDRYDNVTNFNYSPNKAVYQKVDETPYKNLKKNYNKRKNIKIKKENEKKKKFTCERKTTMSEEFLKFNSNFVKAIYYFLCSLVCKVEIRMASEEDNKKINKEKESNYQFISHNISKELIKLKNKSVTLKNIVRKKTSIKKGKNSNNIDDDFDLIEEDEDVEKTGDKISFFIKPYLCFHLSNHTKNYFINNVDRSHANSKYSSLILFSDYCIFEMIYNMRYINKSKLKKKLSEINLYHLEIINFLLIIFENCLLIYHYYKGASSSREEYDVLNPQMINKRYPDIIITIFAKFGFDAFVFFIWFYSQFIIVYIRNIICSGLGTFIFRKAEVIEQNINSPIMTEFFQNNGSLFKAMDLINKNLNVFQRIKFFLFNSILANLEINIFIFSVIFDLLFIFFGNPIFLSVESILIVGIFPSLLNIFKAFKAKFSMLITCLLFTYCIIYIYNWLAIFYLRNSFDFGEVLEYESGRLINEPFCHSSFQCLLVFISYGTRVGGGIAENLPILSFKKEYNMFIARFFYDMSFYIIVIMIMGNITFGLIVDSFGALRDETYKYEKDKEDKCFICQISRDGCLFKSINFESHKNNIHNIWNYVDFLCFLHLYDPNNFTRVEGFVWDKLIEKDFAWIPINKDEDKGDDEEVD